MAFWAVRERIRSFLAEETGTAQNPSALRMALCYPSPYRAAMASLGYQTLYRIVNDSAEWAADRAVLPDEPAAQPPGSLLTFEREQPVASYPAIGFSVAYELEIAGLIQCLELAGIPPLARDRDARHPVVFAGGPLTFSNPAPLQPFVDVVLLGEAEELILPFLDLARSLDFDRARVIDAAHGQYGHYVPEKDGDCVPPIAKADRALLPARSQIITPHSELTSMYLTEAARGCSRGCTYCVMRRSTNGGMRVIDERVILDAIPKEARRVGLVGAAVTDHPRINAIVREIVDSGREIGISSLRADKLNDELVSLLARGGYRTLTTASDGASEAMRERIERRTTEKHLLRAADLGKRHGLKIVKLYMMLGLPGETDADIDELIRFSLELTRVHPKIALGIAPFVAKRNTPLDQSPFAGIRLVEERLQRLRKGVKGKVDVRATSARWAWVEYMLAQGGSDAGLAVLDAYKNGGSFAAYKNAFRARRCEPMPPFGTKTRVPSTAEQIALHQLRRSA
jgi:radical SAM superfamily enzyme YgiQ (UPF0313 family)